MIRSQVCGCLLLFVVASSPALADSLFTVTKLDGTTPYAWDKVPVTRVSEPTLTILPNGDRYWDTLTNGTTSIGYTYSAHSVPEGPDFGGFGTASYTPTGWSVPGNYGWGPTTDFNTRGDVAGFTGNGGHAYSGWFYEGFWHPVPMVFFKTLVGADGKIYHNMNYSPTVTTADFPDFGRFEELLTRVVAIDDKGRFIVASANHYGDSTYRTYLFTPRSLGETIQPAPIPEPSTLALFAAIGVAAAAFRHRRSRPTRRGRSGSEMPISR